jgi:hypothetical protein
MVGRLKTIVLATSCPSPSPYRCLPVSARPRYLPYYHHLFLSVVHHAPGTAAPLPSTRIFCFWQYYPRPEVDQPKRRRRCEGCGGIPAEQQGVYSVWRFDKASTAHKAAHVANMEMGYYSKGSDEDNDED